MSPVTTAPDGDRDVSAVRPPPGPVGVQRLVARATSMEKANWRAIGRLIMRRPAVPPGAEAFSSDASSRPTLITILVVSMVEVVAVDLITHPWPWIRFPLLVLGIWGALFMIGLLIGQVRGPHAVGPEGIRVRSGAEVDLDLPWEVVRGVSVRRRRLAGAPTFCLTGPVEAQTLHHVVDERTDIEVALEHPVELMLPTGPVVATRVHLAVDDPSGFGEAVKRHIP